MKKTLRSILRRSVLGMVAAALALPAAAAEPKKLLLVTVTTGFRHSSIPTAEKVIRQLAKDSGAFTVDLVQQPLEKNNPNFKEDVKKVLEKLSPENLDRYDGVIFANTTGDLPLPDRDAFLKWIESGKAFIGMHSASDTFHGFPPFIEMLGGEFQSHGAQATVDCINEDMQSTCCKHLESSWTVHDEIYLIKSFDRMKVHPLLGLDKEPNKKTPGYFPVSWCKEHGKGKVFYTSLGHREDVWDDKYPDRKNSPEVAKAYQEHILNGIKWALGLAPDDAGFVPLFNGKDLTGWKLRNPNGHNCWTVEPGGVLKNAMPKGEHGTDLVTEKKFWNFTVRYEFMVPDDSNSGFYLRGRHEIQILGDFKAGNAGNGGNGAIYAFKAPDVFASKPGNEWQTAEATMIGDKITLILNGKKIHDQVVCKKATGSEIDNKVNEPGPIFLQGDHGNVAFRNMQIKELPKE